MTVAPAAGRPRAEALGASALLLLLPLAGLLLLLARPHLDVAWQHDPSHFWLVLACAVTNAALAYATGSAAILRGDARVFLVSLAFLAAAGFLGLHALATPGVLLETSNEGFAVATPVGLLLGALLVASSALDLSAGRGRRIVRRSRLARLLLLALLSAWAALSLLRVWPLDGPPAARAESELVGLAVPGIALYGFGVWRYAALLRRRRSLMLAAMAAAFVLLAEAMAAVAFARNWHASWWEWHLLMLLAFAMIAGGVQHEWHEERFASLYLDETVAGTETISVLFADLERFTSFAESHGAAEVAEMLNAYFEVAIPPVVRGHGGAIDRIVGDALMAVFNARGDQPDHAVAAARAALALQRQTARVAEAHPGWPRFRVGVNTGEAALTVLGAAGGRTRTVIGDTVNVAARLEARAPVGGVAVGPETARRLPPEWLEPLGPLELKGKAGPIEAYRLVDGAGS